MKRHNEHQDEGDKAFDSLLASALADYAEMQEAFTKRTNDYASWSIDGETSTLSLVRETGESIRFSVTPIGTYLPDEESWAWAWANDAFSEVSRLRSERIKALSDQTGYKIFTIPSFRASQGDVAELCALALRKLAGDAVFNVKDSSPWAYYVVSGEA